MMTDVGVVLMAFAFGVLVGSALTLFILYCVGRAAQEGP